MIRDFSKEEELETEESVRDTEFTLGGGTLLVLGGGLFVLCTICFGLGYAVGHRGTPDPTTGALPVSALKASAPPISSGSKPGAAGQAVPRLQTQAAPNLQTDNSANSSEPPKVVPAVASGSSPESQVKPAVDSQVRPALAGQTSSAPSSSALQVMPAMTKAQGWMVQIAAVSHPEDAEVLVNALRRRGYSVTARRDTGDSLIHVQTGPFINRNDANAMRQKLLNDGYNAIVQ